MSIENEFYNTPNKDIFSHYTKFQNTSKEKLELIDDTISTIGEIMNRNKVYEKSAEWDEQGAKFENGKVSLPNGFEKVVDEILKENQLGMLALPEFLGGVGLTHTQMGPIVETLCRYDASLAVTALSGLGVMNILGRFYKPEFEEILMDFGEGKNNGYAAFTEPQAGSNLRNIKSTSYLDGDEWVLNGNKIFITNGGFANYGIFLANNIVDGKKDGTNVFLVKQSEGIETIRLEHKSGIRCSPTAELLYKDVRVPKENIIGNVGEGYDKVIERLLGMRLTVSFSALGSCKRAYDLANSYAGTREQFGKTINNFADIKRKFKQMELQLKKMEEWAYIASYSLDRIENKAVIDVPMGNSPREKLVKSAQTVLKYEDLIHFYISGGKIYNGEISNYFLYDAQQVFGGNGFISETEINKIARDVRILSIYDGTSEIHNWVVSRATKGLVHFPDFKRPSTMWDENTIYEDFLFSKFPGLSNNI